MATIRGFIRTTPGGAFVGDGTSVELRAEADNALLDTTTTTNGEYIFTRDGTFPPYRVIAVTPDVTKITSSKVTGMTGATTLSSLPYMFRAWSDGVIAAIFAELEVTASGGSMNVAVASGAAAVHGIVYDQISSRNVTIPAADATNARIDTVVVEVAPAGAGEDIEGRSELKLIVGSPAASPVAPALTQTDTVWQYPLADITVDAGIAAIAAGKVTDRRTFASPSLVAGSVEADHFAASVSEFVQDIVGNMLVPNPFMTIEYNDETGKILVAAKTQGDALTTEDVQDIVASMLTEGSNVNLSYNDSTGKITVSSTASGGGGLTTEQVQDIVGNMITVVGSGTSVQSGDVVNIAVNYSDTTGKVELAIVES